MRTGWLIFALVISLSLVGCGGGGSTVTPPAAITVTMSPSTATVPINTLKTFSASVANSTNTAVTWSVQESNGGTITSAGIYSAPNVAGSYHVVATSQADATKSATSLVTVTAPAPVITSTPTAAAAEGISYTYPLSSTDSTVSFSLITKPAGATITAGVVSWTPSHIQSRVTNSFDVLATTAAGGTAHQSWSVTPAGTVRGTRIATFVTDSGPQDVAQDASTFTIAAYIPNGAGYSKVPGAGTTTGTFSIPNVPTGYYWLKHGNYYFWTATSDIDTGFDQQGRSGLVQGSGIVNFNVSGANPWQDSDLLQVTSSNANVWAVEYPPMTGITQFNLTTSWNSPIIDPTKGDTSYVTQLETRNVSGVPIQVLSRVLGPLAINVGTGTSNISGMLQPVPATGTIRANIKGATFASMLTNMNPNTVQDLATFALDLQPSGASRGWIGATPDLITYSGAITGTDIDLGDVGYGNPFPASWTPFVLGQFTTYVPYFGQGATTSAKLYSYAMSSSTTLPTSSSPFGLLVGPPASPQINVSSLFNDQSAAGTSPSVSWQPPLVGSATGYTLSIYNLSTTSGGASQLTFVATLYTKKTSLVVPPELLTTGLSYVFKLLAVHLPGKDMEQSPYRKAFPYGYAQTSSGVIQP